MEAKVRGIIVPVNLTIDRLSVPMQTIAPFQLQGESNINEAPVNEDNAHGVEVRNQGLGYNISKLN